MKYVWFAYVDFGNIPWMGIYFAIDKMPELNPYLIPYHWLVL